jgi:hypothetical protein
MILTARGDAHALSLAVAAPPGGTVLAAWVTSSGGWVNRGKGGCREALPEGVLPLTAKASLPLDPELAAVLLSGLLPAGARELSAREGWVESSTGAYRLRAQVAGPEPHWTRLVVGRAGQAAPLLEAVRSGGGGVVPQELRIAAGQVKAELALRVWNAGPRPEPPVWLSAPVCGGGP